MSHIVIGKCSCGKNPPCAEACPLEVIHEDKNDQRFIDPNACVDCIDICTKSCKAGGIIPAVDMPKEKADELLQQAEDAITNNQLPLAPYKK